MMFVYKEINTLMYYYQRYYIHILQINIKNSFLLFFFQIIVQCAYFSCRYLTNQTLKLICKPRDFCGLIQKIYKLTDICLNFNYAILILSVRFFVNSYFYLSVFLSLSLCQLLRSYGQFVLVNVYIHTVFRYTHRKKLSIYKNNTNDPYWRTLMRTF